MSQKNAAPIGVRIAITDAAKETKRAASQVAARDSRELTRTFVGLEPLTHQGVGRQAHDRHPTTIDGIVAATDGAQGTTGEPVEGDHEMCHQLVVAGGFGELE